MDFETALQYYLQPAEITGNSTADLHLALQRAGHWRTYGPRATKALILRAKSAGLSYRDIESLSHEPKHDTHISHSTAQVIAENPRIL